MSCDDGRALLVEVALRAQNSLLWRQFVLIVDDQLANVLVVEGSSSTVSTAINVNWCVVGVATGSSNLLCSQLKSTIKDDDTT